MKYFRLFYSTLLDALFPRSKAEIEVFSYTKEEALAKLPKAPDFEISQSDGSTLDYDNMQAIFAYKDEHVSRLIWAIKYKRMDIAVEIGGFALHRTVQSSNNTICETVVLPLPITEKRRRERGYNQCELLVDKIKAMTGEKEKIMFENKLLVRSHHDSHHKDKDRKERLADAKGIFSIDENVLKEILIKNPTLKDAKIIIIDDVITTGSTMREAMVTLRSAGFTNVQGLALAH